MKGIIALNQLKEIQPSIIIKLTEGEKVYGEFVVNHAPRLASVTSTSDINQHKAGGIARALGGGLIAGPIGAVAGAMTAGVRGTTETMATTTKDNQIIDQGLLFFTSDRILFIGQDITSIPYSLIVLARFEKLNFQESEKFKKMIMSSKNLESYRQPFSKYNMPTFGKAISFTINYGKEMINDRYLIVDKHRSYAEGIYRAVSSPKTLTL